MRAKITKRLVDSVEPGSVNIVVRDTELVGFLLVVSTGGAKTYFAEYRAGEGRCAPRRRFKLGRHGPITAEQARSQARVVLGQAEEGSDPQAVREADRRAETVAQLIDLYLAEGVSHKKPSTLRNDRGRIKHHLKPLLGSKRVKEVTRGDVERVLVDVIAGKTAAPKLAKDEKRAAGSRPAGGAGTAAQCVTLLSTIFAFAVDRGLRSDNPAAGIKKPPVRKMERFLNSAEIKRLVAAIEAEATASGNVFPAAAIKLLMFTGCRRGEVLGLRWSEVDFERGCLRLPDSKTGTKVVVVNTPALAILQGLPRIKGNPYVIAGTTEGAALTGIDKIWYRIRAAAELADVRLHDLRHTAASLAVNGGASLALTGKVLGHRVTQTTARYAHIQDDPVRAVAELIGAEIEAAVAMPDKRPPAAGASSGKAAAKQDEVKRSAEIFYLPVRKGA